MTNGQSEALTPGERISRHALGYLLSGGAAAAVDIGLFYWLAQATGKVFLPAVVSLALAYAVNYMLASTLVYRRPWRSLRRVLMYLYFALFGLGINLAVTLVLVDWAGWVPVLAKTGGVAVATVANFLVNTFIVFRHDGER